MNDDVNVFRKYYEPLLSLNNQEDISTGTEFESKKRQFCCH